MSNVTRKGQRLFALSRRRFVSVLAALPTVGLASRMAHALQTPSAMEGPFYPTPSMRFSDADNNLVKIEGQVREAGGEVVVLKGRVFDRDNKPVAGARVEIWQCDAGGFYLHTGDRGRGTYDDAFQGFGHVVTGDDGAYAFRTIKPVPYPGRTPHIHVKVLHGGEELTSQFYLKDHPLNASDFLYQRMTADEQQAVAMVFSDVSEDVPEAVVDIRLG